uniref:Response regulator receiver protein n=1 Tax=Cyanothece sp. (strain PCC 7425 / ATCC 29141) TaxID=395961 RepID=B8HUS8_CYAP4
MAKILVIEDEEPVRANLIELLDDHGYEVFGAENGLLGVMSALSVQPDLILCDVMMPELDGYGVLTALRQDPSTATIPLIFLTAKADKSDIREGMDLGADDYLTKPFTSAELLSSIAVRLEKQAAIAHQYQREQEKASETYHKLEELEQSLQGLRNFFSKLNMLIYVLKQSPQSTTSSLEVLEQECALELALLNRVPQLQWMLANENVDFLKQVGLL